MGYCILTFATGAVQDEKPKKTAGDCAHEGITGNGTGS